MADKKKPRPKATSAKTPKRRWLLLRGLAREVRHWGEFPALLQKAFPKDEVHCLDLPGAGVHFDKACPVGLGKMREHVRNEWRALGEGSADDVILGLSLGGMVAMDWAREYPKEFGTVVLINSSASALSPPWKRLQPQALKLFLQVARSRDPLTKEKRIAGLTNARKLSAAELKERVSFYDDRPISLQNTLRQLYSAVSFPAPEFDPKTHLIVVRGLGDKLCDPDCSEKLARHYRATLQTHPTAGHDLPVDEPRWLVERLKENL